MNSRTYARTAEPPQMLSAACGVPAGHLQLGTHSLSSLPSLGHSLPELLAPLHFQGHLRR